MSRVDYASRSGSGHGGWRPGDAWSRVKLPKSRASGHQPPSVVGERGRAGQDAGRALVAVDGVGAGGDAATSRASTKAVQPLPVGNQSALTALGGVGGGPILQQVAGPEDRPGHRRGASVVLDRPVGHQPVASALDGETTTCPTPAAAASRAGSRSRPTLNSWGGRSRNIRSAPAKVADQVAGSLQSSRTTSRWSSPLRAAPTHAGFHGSDPDRRVGGGSSCTSGVPTLPGAPVVRMVIAAHPGGRR